MFLLYEHSRLGLDLLWLQIFAAVVPPRLLYPHSWDHNFLLFLLSSQEILPFAAKVLKMVMFLIAYTYILKVVIPIDLFDRAIMLVSQSVVQLILQGHKEQRFFTFDCVVEP